MSSARGRGARAAPFSATPVPAQVPGRVREAGLRTPGTLWRGRAHRPAVGPRTDAGARRGGPMRRGRGVRAGLASMYYGSPVPQRAEGQSRTGEVLFATQSGEGQCPEGVCLGASIRAERESGGEQPTRLPSSWWKSSRVKCPCRHVAIPHPEVGNPSGHAWCKRPGRPVSGLRWERPGGLASVGARRSANDCSPAIPLPVEVALQGFSRVPNVFPVT